jgi:hypothetical protein
MADLIDFQKIRENAGAIADNQSSTFSNKTDDLFKSLAVDAGRIQLPGLIISSGQQAAFIAGRRTEERNELIDVSMARTMMWDRLQLKRPEYVNDSGNNTQEATINLFECLLSVTQERHIVRTAIKGAEATHKQFIGNGDFFISVIGRIVNNKKVLPLDFIKNMMYVLGSEEPLEYQCKFLYEGFGIKKVICDTKPKFSQIEGASNAYLFEFTLISDI